MKSKRGIGSAIVFVAVVAALLLVARTLYAALEEQNPEQAA